MAGATAKKALNKTEIRQKIAEQTGLPTKQVAEVLEALTDLAVQQTKKTGTFVLPGFAKILTIRKPATKAGTRPNPFKPGEMMEVKAKPARTVVKMRPLKLIKEAV